MEPGADGIVDASMATVQSGVNVALHPSSVDRLYTPLSCVEVEVKERIAEYKYKVNVLRQAKRIASDGRIAWR